MTKIYLADIVLLQTCIAADRSYEIKYEPVRCVCSLFYNYKLASIYKANEDNLPTINCTFTPLFKGFQNCRILQIRNAKSHKIKPYFNLEVNNILKLAHLEVLCKSALLKGD